MLIFDVKCRVLDAITLNDQSGKEITIAPGRYHLQGVDHLIREASGGMVSSGTEISFVSEEDGKVAYRVSSENLAKFIAMDEVEMQMAGRETP